MALNFIQALGDESAELFHQTGVWIGDLLAGSLPSVLEPNICISPLHQTDMSNTRLLELHHMHHTCEAAKGCKEKSSTISSSRIREHHKVLVKLNDVL